MQRSMAIIVTSGMKNHRKKLKCLQFLPRFQDLPLLFLRNSYLSKNLITIFGNILRQLVSADLSRLVIRDLDKANQDKIAVHLFSVYSSNEIITTADSLYRHKSLGTNTSIIDG